jgi:processive 1,2-diacylglycerol beta-glucosyltransferase
MEVFTMHNVLILTVSVGNGHNQAAFNMQQNLQAAGCTVTTIDFLQMQHYGLPNLLSKAYKTLIEYKPSFFRQICKISEIETFDNVKYMLAKANQRVIGRLVQKYQPDTILCTHFFPLAAAAAYKKKYHSVFKLVGIVTDYIVHPIWDVAYVDQYFVAHSALVSQLKNTRHPLGSVIPSGIPVGSNFTPVVHSASLNNILVMTSWQTDETMLMILNVLQILPRRIHITFVTGNDLPRQKQLGKIAFHHQNYTVIGFTNQVASLMKQSDLLITKPGGLTITEALATATPILVFSPIPGIEEDNARFLEQEHLGYWAKCEDELQNYVTSFLKSPQQLVSLSQNMLVQQSFQASNKILDHLVSPIEQVAL